MEEVKNESQPVESTKKEEAKVEVNYYTKSEVDNLINKAIIEQLTNLIKKNDEPKKEVVKEAKEEVKKEEEIYEW